MAAEPHPFYRWRRPEHPANTTAPTPEHPKPGRGHGLEKTPCAPTPAPARPPTPSTTTPPASSPTTPTKAGSCSATASSASTTPANSSPTAASSPPPPAPPTASSSPPEPATRHGRRRRFVRFAYDAVPGRIVFGRGAVGDLPDELARLGVSRVLLCATERETEQAADLLAPAADRI